MRYSEVVIDPSVVYTTKRGERYNIIENLGKQMQSYGKNVTMVRIRFIDTGYEKDVVYTRAVHGKVSDPYFKDVLGIACKGELDTEFDQNIYNRWYKMISRCYNENDSAYQYYGAKSVTVCPEWLVFANYLRDFKNLPGYNEFATANPEEKDLYHVDKDYLQSDLPHNQRVYSPSTCIIIPANKNSKLVNSSNISPNFIKSYTGVTYLNGVYQASYDDGYIETIIGYYTTDTAAASAYMYFCLDHNIPYNTELLNTDIILRERLIYFTTKNQKEELRSTYENKMSNTLEDRNMVIGQQFFDRSGDPFVIIDISKPERTTYLRAIATIKYPSTGFITKVTTKAIMDGTINGNKFRPSVCGIGAIGVFERNWLSDKIYNMWYRLLQYLTTNYPDNPTAHIYEPWLLFTNFLENVQYLDGYHKFFSKTIANNRLGIYKNVMGIPKENWVFGPDVCYIASVDEEDKYKFMYENNDPNTAIGVNNINGNYKIRITNPYTGQEIRYTFDNFIAAANMYNYIYKAFYGFAPNNLVQYMDYNECMRHRLEGYKKPLYQFYYLIPESENNREARCLARYGMTFD